LEEDTYYNKTMEQLERQQKGLHDQYNSLENKFEPEDYTKVLKADLEFAPKYGENILDYAKKLPIYRDTNAKKNIQTHINGPKGAWYTHRNPAGCFACEDTNLINILVDVIMILSNRHSKETY